MHLICTEVLKSTKLDVNLVNGVELILETRPDFRVSPSLIRSRLEWGRDNKAVCKIFYKRGTAVPGVPVGPRYFRRPLYRGDRLSVLHVLRDPDHGVSIDQITRVQNHMDIDDILFTIFNQYILVHGRPKEVVVNTRDLLQNPRFSSVFEQLKIPVFCVEDDDEILRNS